MLLPPFVDDGKRSRTNARSRIAASDCIRDDWCGGSGDGLSDAAVLTVRSRFGFDLKRRSKCYIVN